jgi:hypothetical protein
MMNLQGWKIKLDHKVSHYFLEFVFVKYFIRDDFVNENTGGKK